MVSSKAVSGPPLFLRLAAHPLRWRLLSALAEGDFRVRELVARIDESQNLVSYHLRLLREAGLVTAGRSSFDGRDTYYHLDLDRCATALEAAGATLHPSLRPGAATGSAVSLGRPRPVSVLFVCTGNSARSPMAEALLNRHGAGAATATSAGTRPKPRLHPEAARVLGEHFGLDPIGHQPQGLVSVAGRRFDRVVTLCDKAREEWRAFPRHRRLIHWSIRDPADSDGDLDTAFLRTAAEIDTRVRHLLPTLVPATDRGGPP